MRSLVAALSLCLIAGIVPAKAESCIASVYSTKGHDQNGTRTASGIPLNYGVATMARPSREHLGHWQTITNTANGRLRTVHVTDLGPFVSGHCVDVSVMAAIVLGCDRLCPVKAKL